MTTTEGSSMSKDGLKMVLEKYKESIKFLHHTIKDKNLTPDEILSREDVFTDQSAHRLYVLFTSLFTELEGMAELYPEKGIGSITPVWAIPTRKLQDLKKKYGVE